MARSRSLYCPSKVFIFVFTLTAGFLSTVNLVNVAAQVFNPATNIYINCGGDDASEPELGFFTSDRNSPYASEGILAVNSGPIEEDDPYPNLLETARLFVKTSEYRIPVVGVGRVWLRLWFYPILFVQSSLVTYNFSSAVFSVSANNIALLSDLRVSGIQSNESDGDEPSYLFSEFLVDVSNGELNVSFQPQVGSFAYVNGLAVVSAPDNLLVNQGGTGASSTAQFVRTASALQTMYRLNVGGSVVIAPNDSSFLSRRWDFDSPYLFGAVAGAPLKLTSYAPIVYGAGEPSWIAPPSVYATARTLPGLRTDVNNPVNRLANLTWVLDVDPGFAYFVRLHFAELNSSISVNERVFNVFVNNSTVLAAYDCVQTGGGAYITSYRDFIVPKLGSTEGTLWLAMSPALANNNVSNVILNGLEVLKVVTTETSAGARMKTVPWHLARYICFSFLQFLFLRYYHS